MAKKPTVLVILDGFGYSDKKEHNAIYHSKKPTFDYLWAHYPHTTLKASGEAVGLLPGYIGNSEVGHMAIGSGKIIKQPVSRVHGAIDNGSFFENKILVDNFKNLKKEKGRLHLIGLLSDAGVHSHIKHLFALIDAAVQNKIKEIIIHPFLDGRDVPPQSAVIFLQQLSKKIKDIPNAYIGSICGRFYGMDRDNNWQRTQKAYDMLTKESAVQFKDWKQALTFYYTKDTSDEFVPPTLLHKDALIQNHDGIVFFNFRPDRARQLTTAFCNPGFKEFQTKKMTLTFFITMVDYNHALETETLLPSLPRPQDTLKDLLTKQGKSIFSIAETEKYAHVTYFFSAGKEEPFEKEEQVLVPSIKTKNYIEHPCMSANEITKIVIKSLKEKPADFYLINYANADMVGHSGDFDATVKAIECLDDQLKKLYEAVVKKMDGTLIITSDHGNAEDMFDEQTKQPKTAHTTNPVPFIVVQKKLENKKEKLPLRELSDIKDFVLKNY